ncbi:MAG: molecular chaperone HtpG [Anaerolineae bacterium]|nr:molecular chaperone HtpG [Anaerolineae bacterium]
MEQHEFKAEIQQLLSILVHSLYTDREIFLRELISNAVDALNRVQFEMLTNREVHDPDVELAIRLSFDAEAKTITVSDTGIGMTRDELVQNLGTIAQSGAASFVRRVQEMDAQERPPIEMIGQFGVGFYSAFMVAGKVRVVSRSYRPDADACEWISDGSASYQVGPAEKATRGTDVVVHLTEEESAFASEWRLEQTVKRHSEFVPFPIYIGDRAINRQKPLWREPSQQVEQEAYDEFYRYLTHDTEAPILHIAMTADVPVDIRSILYVPSRRDRSLLTLNADYGLRLYARGVLIQEHNKEMLPNYFRFLEGVIESEDLPLNVSRETVQRNPAVRRIQKALVGKVVRELADLAEADADKYARFWDEFGIFVKEGVATDMVGQQDLLPLLRFHSSFTVRDGKAGRTSLKSYVERMPAEQTAIYYLTGESIESIERSPHLDYFRSNDLEVLYLVDAIDSFLVMALREFDGKPLHSADDPSLELPDMREPPQQEDTSEGDLQPLIARAMRVLGEKVAEVRESKVLRDSPCRLVVPEGAAGRDVQRVYRLLNEEFETPARILEVNRRHPLIRGLVAAIAQLPADPAIDLTIEQLYDNQLLLEGTHPSPADMVQRLEALMEAAVNARAQPRATEDEASET